jgi:hypothetical protein
MPEVVREAAKEAHGFERWPGADAAPLPHRFVPDVERLPGYSHERRDALPGGAFIDHFSEDDGEGRIAVRVIQYATARAAHEGLVDVLATSMAPRLPSCEERGLDLGGPCFCGHGEPIDFLAFTRANVLVRLDSSGRMPVAVNEAAAELDRQLAEARGS